MVPKLPLSSVLTLSVLFATAAMTTSVTRRSALRKVKFGTTDMQVSELCVGSMTWGSFISDEAAAHAQLDVASAAGDPMNVPCSRDCAAPTTFWAREKRFLVLYRPKRGCCGAAAPAQMLPTFLRLAVQAPTLSTRRSFTRWRSTMARQPRCGSATGWPSARRRARISTLRQSDLFARTPHASPSHPAPLSPYAPCAASFSLRPLPYALHPTSLHPLPSGAMRP